MDSETLTLIIIWALAVVAFFVLWALLAKVVQRISKRKNADDANLHDAEPTKTLTEHHD